MKKSIPPIRKKFCGLVKAIGIRYKMPISKIYQSVYDRIRTETGVNLYLEAKKHNMKPLDVAEKHQLFGRMIDIANNVGFEPIPDTGTRKPIPPTPLFENVPDNIDPETGEVLD